MDIENPKDGKAEKLRQTVSACLIVRDEEQMLPGCLASIKELADEIIVVDTGSKDATAQIAADFGCRLYNYPWNDNFAAARNESLKYANGDWIFIIDADEELPRGQIGTIRGILKSPNNKIISISVYNKSPDTGQVSSFLPSVRFFRRCLGLQYEGIVHNRLALPSDIPVVRCGIKLYHYGYDLPPEKLGEKKRRSLKLLQKQLDRNPDDVYANFNMAQLLRGINGMQEAETCRRILAHAQKVINIGEEESPGSFACRLMAYIQAASSLLMLGEFDEAERYCLEALNRKPDYIDAVLTLANIYLAAKKTIQAEKYYRRYLELFEKYNTETETADIIMQHVDAGHMACYGLAQSLINQGKLDQSLPFIRRAIELKSDDINYRLFLARILLFIGRNQEGKECLKEAIKDVSGDPQWLLAAGNVYFNAGEIESAEEYFKRALKIKSDYHEALNNLANCRFQLGEFTEAREYYERLIHKCPDFWPAYRNLGLCHARLGEAGPALEILMKYAENNIDDIQIYAVIGNLFSLTGYYNEAIGSLEKYLKTYPEDAVCLLSLADIYDKLGYYEAAQLGYRKVMELDPGNRRAAEMAVAQGKPEIAG